MSYNRATVISVILATCGVLYSMTIFFTTVINDPHVKLRYQTLDSCQIDRSFDPLHPNKIIQCVAKYYDEFNQRFFMDISHHSDWISFLSQPNLNSSDKTCIHMLDDLGGFGNRIYRDPAAFFMAYMHGCTFANHWGFCHNHTNFFADLFSDSYELIACKYPVTKHSLQNTKANYILTNINLTQGHELKPIHPTIQKLLPFTTILVEVETNTSKSTIMTWNETSIWTDYPLPRNSIFLDDDIDESYGELRPWNGYMKWYPVLRYYGLLIQQLRYKYRVEIAAFLQTRFRHKFIIAIHIRSGRNETGFNRYQASDENIVYQITHNFERLLPYIFNKHAIFKHNVTNYRNINDFGFFVAGDYFGAVSIVRKLVQNIWNNITMNHDNMTSVDWNKIVFTRTKVEWSTQKKFTFGKNDQSKDCVIDAKDAYIDSELLGFSDVLILPYVSTFTRVSRALMMKRKKIICHSETDRRNMEARWFCKDFNRDYEWKYVT